MAAKNPTHGGPRAKAGRPRKPAREKVVKVTVCLPRVKAALAQSLGGSNALTPNLPAIRRGILAALEGPILSVGG